MLPWATFDQDSNIVRVKILDSAVATGAGKTGLTSASSGLIISTIADVEATATVYTVAGSNVESITTLGTFAAPSTNKCRFKEVDATNHPGVYELQFANARFSVTGAKSLLISISGATGAAQCDAIIPLPRVDLFESNGRVRLTEAQIDQMVDELLDEVNTGATHNVNNSVGKQIRQGGGGTQVTIRSGTLQAGSTSTTAKLDTGASTTNDLYNRNLIVLTGGTGAGQTRRIVDYVGSSRVATVDRPWAVTPDNTTTFDLVAGSASVIVDEGTAQAADATHITLATTASASDDIYNGSVVAITGGTGAGQTREITDYVGATRVALVNAAWSVTPDATSVYAVVPAAEATADTGGAAGLTAAEVKAEMVAALNTDTYAEPGQEAPGATVSLARKLGYLYKAWRNKHDQTAVLYRLYSDGGVVDQKAATSDAAGTTTRDEVASGP